MSDDEFPGLSDDDKARIMDEVDAEQGRPPVTERNPELTSMAGVLLAQHGIEPEDLARLADLGVSDTGVLEVRLPAEFNPSIVATLLVLMAQSVLDVAAASREANQAVAELVAHMQAGRKLQ